ncbi:MAG: AAC(3) family N-acetyltransferase [Thermanaerothrix sp.]|nr:AAC(3) family N-acetyltransferase [Thermanaerothrix sp.]
MIGFRDVMRGLQALEIGKQPVIVHASLSAFGPVRGGAETIVGALLTTFPGVMAPTHTYKTMLIPEDGPTNNGLTYGSGKAQNAMAEFFTLDMPADPLMGIIPETLRRHPQAKRSGHPILSFAGVGVESALNAQTLEEPLAPIRVLMEQGGWVLLLGVNHTVNTSLHLAERMAGRRQFLRWALTPQAVVACPRFPGCSLGFEQAEPLLRPITREVKIGNAIVRALPLAEMIERVIAYLKEDPMSLLCSTPDCERCEAVRLELAATRGLG